MLLRLCSLLVYQALMIWSHVMVETCVIVLTEQGLPNPVFDNCIVLGCFPTVMGFHLCNNAVSRRVYKLGMNIQVSFELESFS
mmetsp:Transcript_6047/g.13540  ORF Transcript_6047/g.13540 Transcript_6047/m.13540 type:complete len:83 (-) Transcript_6047:327-575(-)